MDATFGQFWRALGNPEYRFLFLEPVLIYGTGFGLVTYLFALLVREQKSQMFALLILIGSVMCVSPYLNQREDAQARIVGTYEIDQPSRAVGFAEHTKEIRAMRWLYFWTAFWGIMALLFNVGKGRLGWVFCGIAVVSSLITIGYSCKFHYAESRLYHPNLRQSEIPPGPVMEP